MESKRVYEAYVTFYKDGGIKLHRKKILKNKSKQVAAPKAECKSYGVYTESKAKDEAFLSYKDKDHTLAASERRSYIVLPAKHEAEIKRATICVESMRENANTNLTFDKDGGCNPKSGKITKETFTPVSTSNAECKSSTTCMESKRVYEAYVTFYKDGGIKLHRKKILKNKSKQVAAPKAECKSYGVYTESKAKDEAFLSYKDKDHTLAASERRSYIVLPAKHEAEIKRATICVESMRENANTNLTFDKDGGCYPESGKITKETITLVSTSNGECKSSTTSMESKRDYDADVTFYKDLGTKRVSGKTSGKSTKIAASKAKVKAKANCFIPIQAKIICKREENDISYKDGDCKPDSQNLCNDGSKLVTASAHKRIVSFVKLKRKNRTNLKSHKEEGCKLESKKIRTIKHQITAPRFKRKKISAPVESRRKMSNVKSSADNDKEWEEDDENSIANSGVLEILNPTTENLIKYIMPRNVKSIVSRPEEGNKRLTYPPVSKQFVRLTVMDVKKDSQYINFFNKTSNDEFISDYNKQHAPESVETYDHAPHSVFSSSTNIEEIDLISDDDEMRLSDVMEEFTRMTDA